MVLGIRSAEKGMASAGMGEIRSGFPFGLPRQARPGLRRPSTSSGQAASGLRGLPLRLPPEVSHVRAEPNEMVGQPAGLRKSDFHALEQLNHASDQANPAVGRLNHGKPALNRVVESISDAVRSVHHKKYLGHFKNNLFCFKIGRVNFAADGTANAAGKHPDALGCRCQNRTRWPDARHNLN